MSETDYSKIASRYDNNPIRKRYEKDNAVSEQLEKFGRLNILDLACGTGNYLKAQSAMYRGSPVVWHGIDLSVEMLALAREKLPDFDLRQGTAEALPYSDSFFGMIVCSFAFHHFMKKDKVLKEVHRVMAAGGLFVMRNICPERMLRSWIYNYFPSARSVDDGRFWSAGKIFDSMKTTGFEPEITVTVTIRDFPLAGLLAEAKNRDMSQLNLIDEDEYAAGIAALERDSPGNAVFCGDFALLECRARKP